MPLGTTVRELIDLAGGVNGGRKLLAFAPGGASSNFLPADKADVQLDFDDLAKAGSMLGSGALVVVAEGTDLLALAANVTRFFRNESCGKCVPCRVGSREGGGAARRVIAASRRDGADRAAGPGRDDGASPRSAAWARWRWRPALSVLKHWPAGGGRRCTSTTSPSTASPVTVAGRHDRLGRREGSIGIDIPVLCHHPQLRPVGVCRMCVVDVGGRVLAASCVRPCEEGMKVETARRRSRSSGGC